MKNYKVFIFLIFLTFIAYSHVLHKNKSTRAQTSRGFIYSNETCLPQKILICSYGSLVKQKMNRKTGDILYAGPFIKTTIKIPISFTFLAGYPPTGHKTSCDILRNYKNRRATAAIDADSDECKNLWIAVSDFSSLSNARNNLAAREGAPLINKNQGYDLSSIFYLRQLGNSRKKPHEECITEFPEWVMLRPSLQQQRLSTTIIHQLIKILKDHNAHAAIWVALPDNIKKNELFDLLKDPVFVTNTYRYIQNMPPNNIMTTFENKVVHIYESPTHHNQRLQTE